MLVSALETALSAIELPLVGSQVASRFYCLPSQSVLGGLFSPITGAEIIGYRETFFGLFFQ
jgi:hypothetical protein